MGLLLLTTLGMVCQNVYAKQEISSEIGRPKDKGKWKKKDGEKYYLKADGEWAVKSCKIEGTYYVFDMEGKLLHPRKNTLVRVGKKIYYVSPKGTAVSGWHIIKKKLYSVAKTGAVRTDRKYEGITLTETGAAKMNKAAKMKMKIMQVFKKVTDPQKTKKQNLRACWNYVVSRKFHYRMKYPNINKKGWQITTAYDMFTTKKGNCYSFACAFAAMAKELGYKPKIVCGRVSGSRDRARDHLTKHAWVRIDGYNYDPEAQYAGWMRGIYHSSQYPIRHTIQKVVTY